MASPLETSGAIFLQPDELENRQKRVALLSFSGLPAEPSRKNLIEDIVTTFKIQIQIFCLLSFFVFKNRRERKLSI